ncbi:MAG: ABC transporter substrate-binding protein [Pseudomonadaceae bacterium]|nr:ABC transporter substrate-binding protein [Pseudomonadaceae bacterium]
MKLLTQLIATAVLGLTFALSATTLHAATANEVIEQATADVLALIEEGKTYADEDPERFYAEVRQVLDPVVNFDAIARNVMGVHSKRASDEQKARFAENFRTGLVRTYALALTEFSDGEVVVLPNERPSRNPKRASVNMEIRLPPAQVYPVVYSMGLGKDEQWRMLNIIINGVNMGLTYRSQFLDAMKDAQYGGDLDRVIDGWAAVVSDVDPNGVEEEGGNSQSPAADAAAAEQAPAE